MLIFFILLYYWENLIYLLTTYFFLKLSSLKPKLSQSRDFSHNLLLFFHLPHLLLFTLINHFFLKVLFTSPFHTIFLYFNYIDMTYTFCKNILIVKSGDRVGSVGWCVHFLMLCNKQSQMQWRQNNTHLLIHCSVGQNSSTAWLSVLRVSHSGNQYIRWNDFFPGCSGGKKSSSKNILVGRIQFLEVIV